MKVVKMLSSLQIIREAEKKLADRFDELEENAYQNQAKVLTAFKKYHLRDSHFNPSSGYGYGDIGRERLEDIYAEVFKGEDALVRSQIVSGTHAISSCLFAILRPGDQLLSISGRPYDTLANIIGQDNNIPGTLVDRGIYYEEVKLDQNGHPDYKAISAAINKNTTMVLIQRSRGYSLRPAFGIEEIAKMVRLVKEKNSFTIIMVDNCYGEFVELREPLECGADIMAGSLIKNPGGGLAPSGGYITGKQELVEKVAYHLTAPGLGKEMGAFLINKRNFFQGLFVAPHVVLQALKSALLLAYIFEQRGYQVSPRWDEQRADIVQAVMLKNPDEVLQFCQLVQSNSPVDSDLSLEFGEMPGYSDKIVMAAGTFIQGSSIELSCDAPLREPYAVYMQGGLTYEHSRFVIKELMDNLIIGK
jgi:cystathionine beta-lyase family protein involved in aluminum resistance